MDVSAVGRGLTRAIEGLGYAGALLTESLLWLVVGSRQGQPVKLQSIAEQMMRVGVEAVPIVSILAMTVGLSLGIQLISTLSEFGAEC